MPTTLDQPPAADPTLLFRAWYDEAVQSGAAFPDAMTLATATPEGRPSARIVLYKGMSENEILFVTNYDSQKARELDGNPRAALVFFWPALARQVRIEGPTRRAEAAESDAYFRGRPRESQLGAWASPQSRLIASRDELEQRFSELDAQFAERDIDRPPFWGGYKLMPDIFEFWISQRFRLHDRFRYERSGASWQCQRLAP